MKPGVSKLTVYNHFQDKATLFSCAIEDTCEAILHEHPQILQPSSDFAQEFYRACLRALNIISLPEAIKLDLLLMELASQQSPLAEQFYQASHAKLEAVWHDFFALAQHYQFIQVDRPEKQTELIVSLLTGTRHQKILLGLTAPPSSTEQQQIISQAIELFMLKYGISG